MARKATAKRATAKRATAKRATAKKATAKKATAKRATAKRATAKKATAKKATAKKATAKKATAKKATAGHFSPRLFRFLRELEENNERDWFQANKARFDEDVKAPLLGFIEGFAGPLAKLSPHHLADPKPVGGSMFRIYRDVRFSLDKSPYKTMASAQFRHERAKEVSSPCFYLHLEPGQIFGGFGIYHPDTRTQRAVREAIVADPKRWKKIVGAKAFKDNFTLGGDSLKRPPAGIDKEHELIEDLKRKDFIAVCNYSEKQLTSPDFMKTYVQSCKAGVPLVHFICDAVGLER